MSEYGILQLKFVMKQKYIYIFFLDLHHLLVLCASPYACNNVFPREIEKENLIMWYDLKLPNGFVIKELPASSIKSKFFSCRNASIIYSRLPVFPLQEYLTNITTTCSSCWKPFLQACSQFLTFMKDNEKRRLEHKDIPSDYLCLLVHVNV